MTEPKTQQEILSALVKTGYEKAGVEFMAYKLSRLIRPIESEADRVLFNDVAEEVRMLLGNNTDSFLKRTAETILRIAAQPQEKENGKEEFKR